MFFGLEQALRVLEKRENFFFFFLSFLLLCIAIYGYAQ